jgi:uncharacterized protein YndB with AHSA1/START domain
MTTDECPPIEVSCRVAAPADRIFALLRDPRQHPAIDGSDMVVEPVTTEPVSGVGDVFVMRMQSRKWGDYEIDNHVVQYEQDRAIAWEPQAGRGHPLVGTRHGHVWAYLLSPDGPGATVVTETYDCSRAPAQERAEMRNGELWREGMVASLERLRSLCEG